MQLSKVWRSEMGSGYYGEINTGSNNNNGSSSSNSASSSRRKKKSSTSPNKPKQPQRGLGVAQLEKIRLRGQLGCTSYFPNNSISPRAPYMDHRSLNYTQEAYGSVPPSGSSYDFHQPNVMMGRGNMERANMVWNLDGDSTGYAHESQQQLHYSQAGYMTRPFFCGHGADEARRNDNEWGRSGSHDSGSSGTQQEVDLDLRL